MRSNGDAVIVWFLYNVIAGRRASDTCARMILGENGLIAQLRGNVLTRTLYWFRTARTAGWPPPITYPAEKETPQHMDSLPLTLSLLTWNEWFMSNIGSK